MVQVNTLILTACSLILIMSDSMARSKPRIPSPSPPAQATRPAYLPDPKLTPGDVLAMTKEDICSNAEKILSHMIPIGLRREVFDRYGIKADAPGSFQVDRLIPAHLGGSNSLQNLWPQPLTGEWSAMLKNRLENHLHKMVCKGNLDLKTTQQEIASDWVTAYKKYMGEPNAPTSRSGRNQ